MKEESQIRHERLIDFLSQFRQYQDKDGKPTLKKVPKELNSSQFKDISINDINHAVVVFTDVLNLNGGSVGNYDFYQLLQKYIHNEEFRKETNDKIRHL
jgi:hypothetical protein